MAQSNAFKLANNILSNGSFDGDDLKFQTTGGDLANASIGSSGISFISVVPGTITDGAISIQRLRYNTTNDVAIGALTPLTTFAIEGVGVLSGDVDYFEVLVTALNIDASATPTVFNTKSWKFRGYAYRIEDVTAYTEIGTTEILGSLGTTTGLSASLSIDLGGLIMTLNQASLPGSFTWAIESKTFTVHKGYTPFGGGGGG
jgi:hypothetical protein